MMNCNELAEVLADYLGDELSSVDRKAIQQHLSSCPTCAREVESLQETVTTLGQLDTISHADAAGQIRGLQIVQRRPAIQRFVLASLRIAAVLALGFVLGRASFESPTTSDVMPAGPSGDNRHAVAQASTGSIHPDWLVIAERINQNSSGLAGAFRHLAKDYKR